MTAPSPDRPIVFRSTFGVVLTVVAWAISAVGVGTTIGTGGGVVPLVLFAALAWFVWLMFWRPCVVTDSRGVVLRNVVSDIDIPYDAIEDVDTRYSLRIRASGRLWSAWGAPAPGGASALRAGTRRPRADDGEAWRDAPRSVREGGTARPGDAAATVSGAPATVIRRELERRDRDGVPRDRAANVRVHRRAPLIAVSAVLVVAAAGSVLLGA